ncbi:MAG: hypothetical protein PVI52_09555 [Chromatiales bacterium]|jgi:hypothetical protein
MKQTEFMVRWFTWPLLVLLLLLAGCTNEYTADLQKNKQIVTSKLETLGQQLDAHQLSNGRLIEAYAENLSAAKPELSSVTELLAKDATTNGTLYKSLQTRLAALPDEVDNRDQFIPAFEELQSLNAATDPAIFNDSLLDVVNTLADLSDGDLPRVSIPRDEDVSSVKGGGHVAGSYLVGNPAYGQWKSDSGGSSFWEFYGQYRLFSDLFLGRDYYRGPIRYDDWYGGRARYSYYNDYARSTYGTRSDRNAAKQHNQAMANKGITPAKPKKTYGSAQGRKRVSTYTSMQKDYRNKVSKKFGAGDGPRHAGDIAKRQSSLFGGNRSTSGSSTPSKRTSSLFGSSFRSSSRSSGFGGK